MKKLTFVFVLAFFSYSVFGQYTKVAMLETIPGSDGISSMILNMVRGELTKIIASEDDFSAFARADIDEMMEELNFQQSGMVDDEQLTELGKMSGANFVCLSKISKDGQTYYIEASLINIETGKIQNPSTAFVNGGGMTAVNTACKGIALDLMGKENNHDGVYGSNSNNYKSEGSKTEKTSADKPTFPIVFAQEDVLFNITSCKLEGNELIISGLVQNNLGVTAVIGLLGKEVKIYTDLGNVYQMKVIKLGDKKCKSTSYGAYQKMPDGVIMRFDFVFENVPKSVNNLSSFMFNSIYEFSGERSVRKQHTINNIPVEH
jgi:hypothetical protein